MQRDLSASSREPATERAAKTGLRGLPHKDAERVADDAIVGIIASAAQRAGVDRGDLARSLDANPDFLADLKERLAALYRVSIIRAARMS